MLLPKIFQKPNCFPYNFSSNIDFLSIFNIKTAIFKKFRLKSDFFHTNNTYGFPGPRFFEKFGLQ